MVDDDVIFEEPGKADDLFGRNQPVVLRMDGETVDVAAAVFAPGGALTVSHVKDIASRFDTALQTADGIAVDLAGVGDCDTAGIQLLIAMRRRAVELDKECEFRAPSSAVTSMARCIGVDLSALIGG